MAVNLIELFQNEVGGDLVKHASGFLQESPQSTQKAVSGILPSLMGSLAQQGTSPGGAEKLMGMLSSGNFDGSLLNNIGSMFGGGGAGQLDGLLNQGGGLLSGLLGDKQNALTDTIANYAGIKPGSTSKLMSMAAPLLMSLVGRRVMKNGLDIGGLMDMFSGQSKHIKSAMPDGLSGIGNLLGFKGDLAGLGDSLKKGAESMGNTASAAASGAASTAQSTLREASTTAKRTNWLPWLIGALVILALLYFIL